MRVCRIDAFARRTFRRPASRAKKYVPEFEEDDCAEWAWCCPFDKDDPSGPFKGLPVTLQN
jgi:hypothetical protein